MQINNLYTFMIDAQNNEKFIIHLDDPDDMIHCCYQSYVTLYFDTKKRVIGKDIIAEFMQQLKRRLISAIYGNLALHESIVKDIGYYWNQDLNEDSPDLFLVQGEEYKYWVGSQYLLWTTNSRKKHQRYATWLYNDKQGNIIFEVTPTYPETFIDTQDAADVALYQAWMTKKYKPFFIRIISQEVALQWLNQAEAILQLIRDNVAILEQQYEK